MDTATGLITGTPGSTGDTTITIRAINVFGTDQQTLVITTNVPSAGGSTAPTSGSNNCGLGGGLAVVLLLGIGLAITGSGLKRIGRPRSDA